MGLGGVFVPLGAGSEVWRCWRVDFARAETRQPKEGGLMKGLAPKAKGDDEREVSKVIRKKAVEQFMENLKVPTTDWQHDGAFAAFSKCFQVLRQQYDLHPDECHALVGPEDRSGGGASGPKSKSFRPFSGSIIPSWFLGLATRVQRVCARSQAPMADGPSKPSWR